MEDKKTKVIIFMPGNWHVFPSVRPLVWGFEVMQTGIRLGLPRTVAAVTVCVPQAANSSRDPLCLGRGLLYQNNNCSGLNFRSSLCTTHLRASVWTFGCYPVSLPRFCCYLLFKIYLILLLKCARLAIRGHRGSGAVFPMLVWLSLRCRYALCPWF